jgi:hypothetical protein
MYVQIAHPLVGDQEIKADRGLKLDICWRENCRMAWAAFAVSQLFTYQECENRLVQESAETWRCPSCAVQN